MFEGTFKYILMLLGIYVLSYIVKKIEMAKIFKKAKEKPSKAFIPFLCTKTLINVSHANSKLFGLTLIPFVNIPAYINIYKEMLKTFGQDPKEAPMYFFFPMIYFTKLGSGSASEVIHDYDISNEYLEAQSMLYEPVIGETEKPLYEMTDPGYYIPKPKEEIVYRVARRNKNEINDPIKIMAHNPVPVQEENPNQNLGIPRNVPDPAEPKSVPEAKAVKPEVSIFDIPVNEKPKEEIKESKKIETINVSGPKSVFTDNSLEPDKRKERVVEAKQEEKQLKNPITENITGRPKMCPNCGAKLAAGAKVCFLCGTHLSWVFSLY